jgi:hypothetical protein
MDRHHRTRIAKIMRCLMNKLLIDRHQKIRMAEIERCLVSE